MAASCHWRALWNPETRRDLICWAFLPETQSQLALADHLEIHPQKGSDDKWVLAMRDRGELGQRAEGGSEPKGFKLYCRWKRASLTLLASARKKKGLVHSVVLNLGLFLFLLAGTFSGVWRPI